MKKAYLSLLLIISFVVFACETEPLDAGIEDTISTNNPNNPTDPTNPTDPANPTDPGTGGNSTGDYWPMAIGNNWTFTSIVDGVADEDYALEIGGLEDFQGNQSYLYDQFFDATQATDGTQLQDVSVPTYSRKDGGDYHIGVGELSVEIDGLFQISQTGFEYILLKDYLPVGSTWSQDYSTVTTTTVLIDGTPPIPPTTLNNEVDLEILEKDVSVTVNGTTYSPVIKVRFTMVTSTPGLPTASSVDYVYSFAKDVGIVKVDGVINDVDSGVVSTIVYELSSYELF